MIYIIFEIDIYMTCNVVSVCMRMCVCMYECRCVCVCVLQSREYSASLVAQRKKLEITMIAAKTWEIRALSLLLLLVLSLLLSYIV